MNVLDWLLVVLVLAYALSGYWQGFVTGAFATGGLLLGGLFGVWLAPVALGNANPSLLVSLGALFIVILAASLGQGLLQYVGARIRDKITWQPVRSLDAVGGAALSAAAVLLVAWALGVAISGSPIGGVTPLVRNSTDHRSPSAWQKRSRLWVVSLASTRMGVSQSRESGADEVRRPIASFRSEMRRDRGEESGFVSGFGIVAGSSQRPSMAGPPKTLQVLPDPVGACTSPD